MIDYRRNTARRENHLSSETIEIQISHSSHTSARERRQPSVAPCAHAFGVMTNPGTMDQPPCESIYIAPLQITKDGSRTPSSTSSSSQNTLKKCQTPLSPQARGQITPPLTPHGSMENISLKPETHHLGFHTYLRAFYPFHPLWDESSSTVTLPLNQGDVILVHSVHTNGWADGTLLMSGARGWLPTNYCEVYDVEPIHNLLKALTNFWDLVRGGSIGSLEAFASQDYIRGLVAGVRCLLVGKTTICEQYR